MHQSSQLQRADKPYVSTVIQSTRLHTSRSQSIVRTARHSILRTPSKSDVNGYCEATSISINLPAGYLQPAGLQHGGDISDLAPGRGSIRPAIFSWSVKQAAASRWRTNKEHHFFAKNTYRLPFSQTGGLVFFSFFHTKSSRHELITTL